MMLPASKAMYPPITTKAEYAIIIAYASLISPHIFQERAGIMKKKRLNGEGGLYFDKDRQQWVGSLYDRNKKRHRFRHADKMAVIDWLNKWRPVYCQDNKLCCYDITLQNLAFAFIQSKAENPKIAEGTINYYTYLASKLFPLATMLVSVISARDITQFLATADLSDSNKLKVYQFLRILFGAAARDKIIIDNPILKVEAPEYEPTYDEPFTPEEIRHIITFLKSEPKFMRYYALIVLETVTGARIGEILSIERASIDFSRNCYKITQAVKPIATAQCM